MKKLVTVTMLSLFATAIFAQHSPQKRALTKTELQRYFDVCNWITDALPKTFKNYETKVKNCNDPSAFSLEMDGKGGYNTAVIGNNQAAGFLPSTDISYSNLSADSIYQSQSKNFDYTKYMNNADSVNAQEARTIKIMSCKSLKLVVSINSGTDGLKEFFDISTKPEPLNVTNATFSTLYKMPFGKPIIEEDGAAQHHSEEDEMYADRAVITFGVKPVVKTTTALQKQSYHIASITIPDDGKLILLDKIKQISVFIYGSEQDIKELIKSIDWNKVYNLIGK